MSTPPTTAVTRPLTHAQHVAIGRATDDYLLYRITYREMMSRIRKIEHAKPPRRRQTRRRGR